jgi:hypothetical protein
VKFKVKSDPSDFNFTFPVVIAAANVAKNISFYVSAFDIDGLELTPKIYLDNTSLYSPSYVFQIEPSSKNGGVYVTLFKIQLNNYDKYNNLLYHFVYYCK